MLVATLSDPELVKKALGLGARAAGSKFEGERQVASCRKQLKALLAFEREQGGLRGRSELSAEGYEASRTEIQTDRATLEASLKLAADTLAQAAVASDAVRALQDGVADVLQVEQDRVMKLIGEDDDQAAAGMRWNVLAETASFEQRRKAVELLVPRAAGYGVFLHDGGRVEVKGVAELPERACANMIRGDPGPARQYRAAK